MTKFSYYHNYYYLSVKTGYFFDILWPHAKPYAIVETKTDAFIKNID